jgi:hypothetical protein
VVFKGSNLDCTDSTVLQISETEQCATLPPPLYPHGWQRIIVREHCWETMFRIHDILVYIRIRIRGPLTIFVIDSRNQGFSYYFCLLIEGPGSGRPKNMIRWIRIRNTVVRT